MLLLFQTLNCQYIYMYNFIYILTSDIFLPLFLSRRKKDEKAYAVFYCVVFSNLQNAKRKKKEKKKSRF